MSELCLSAVRGVVSTVDISCHMGIVVNWQQIRCQEMQLIGSHAVHM
jgi:hypothetical protein